MLGIEGKYKDQIIYDPTSQRYHRYQSKKCRVTDITRDLKKIKRHYIVFLFCCLLILLNNTLRPFSHSNKYTSIAFLVTIGHSLCGANLSGLACLASFSSFLGLYVGLPYR
jgi:hypothetical protein